MEQCAIKNVNNCLYTNIYLKTIQHYSFCHFLSLSASGWIRKPDLRTTNLSVLPLYYQTQLAIGTVIRRVQGQTFISYEILIYIHVYIHTPTLPHTHTPTQPHNHTPTHPHTQTPTHPHTHTPTHPHTHTTTHPHTHPPTPTPTHTSTHTYTHTCIWLCVYTYQYVWVGVDVWVYVCVCVSVCVSFVYPLMNVCNWS